MRKLLGLRFSIFLILLLPLASSCGLVCETCLHPVKTANKATEVGRRINPKQRAENFKGVVEDGSMRDKDINRIANLLFPKAETLILTRPDNSRAMAANEIAGFVPVEFEPGRVHLTESVDEALTQAQRLSNDGLILVTGSLYLVGEAQKILKARSQI